MFLFITASRDVHANLLLENFNLNAFRLNYDLWQDYSIQLEPGRWQIANPAGRIVTSETATHCFWWKPFNSPIHADPYLVAEITYVFRELYGSFLTRGLTVGSSPDFHNRYGKLQILRMASKYFRTPDTLCGWNLPSGDGRFAARELVAKSLSSELTSEGRLLFTTAVDYAQIDRTFPWYLQTRVEAHDDVTVFVCADAQFAFSRSRRDLAGLDWRRVIPDTPEQSGWRPRPLSPDESKGLRDLCRDLDVAWGRFDLMEDDRGLVFLEYNANGQFGFLDFYCDNGLMRTVADYIATPPSASFRDIAKSAPAAALAP